MTPNPPHRLTVRSKPQSAPAPTNPVPVTAATGAHARLKCAMPADSGPGRPPWQAGARQRSHRPRSGRALCLLSALLCGTGCQKGVEFIFPFVYRIDIQQGVVLEQPMLYRLTPGMRRAEVQEILGTPSLVDPFHADRWYYIYTLQENDGPRRQRQAVLHFKDDALALVDGDIHPRSGPLPDPEADLDQAVRVPDQKQRGLFGWLFRSKRAPHETAGPAADSGEEILQESEQAKKE